MLKWLTLSLLVGLAYCHPGVYDEYSYDDDEGKGEEDGDYYLYYEEESEESDIDDEELKKITDAIAEYSYEEETPQKGRGAGKGQKHKNKQEKNKQRSKRSADGPVSMNNRKAWKSNRDAAAALSRPKRFLDSLRLDKIILPVFKEVVKQHPRPLTKEQRDEISGGFFGWQYAMLSEDCCTCKEDNICSCCPSTNVTGSECVKFVAQPNRAQVSIDIGQYRHVQVTVAKNSRSSGCENSNLKEICLYSDGFTTTSDGYKACVIITNNVKDPKSGVVKCINYSNGKSTISDS